MNLLKLIGGVIALTASIWLFIYLLKHPIDPENDVNKAMFQGYISVFLMFVLGILLILSEIKKIFL